MQDRNERFVDRITEREKRENYRQTKQAFLNRVADSERQRKIERENAKAEHEYNVYRSAELEFDRSPITEVPHEVELPMSYFDEVAHKVDYNAVYAEHYRHRYEDTNKEIYRSMSERIEGCHKSWFGDRYKAAGVFDVKRVFHCHNRWCWLCSHLKQAKRLYKFHILFEKLLQEYDLYHLVFTVPNVKGADLKDTLERMHVALYKMIRRFQGKGKIKDIDFEQYGFAGAIRSFEIVINPFDDYHPHLHVLFMLKKGLDFPKTEINKYSFSNGVMVRKFSKFEILLQKMFYLAVNKQRLTPKNIEGVKIGYSCMMDFVEGEMWHEVFKYATKMSKDGASACSYEQFCLLDDILRRMKLIQGYGIFYNMDEPDPETDPTAEILFEKVLILLNKIDKPERGVHIELDKLVNELHEKNLTVISRKMSYKYLQAVVEELQAEFKIEENFEPF